MKQIWQIAWQRFNTNAAIIADVNGRFIATVFYFSIMVPFGLLSALFMDPLRRKPSSPEWLEREPLPTDMPSAKEQG